MTDQCGKRQKKGRGSCSQTANHESGRGAEEEVGDEERRGIEGFPVGVIGKILSHVGDVKDVVRASMTCRKWREALRHLYTLRVTCNHPVFRTEKLEFLLTDTILRTEITHLSYEQLFSSSGDCLAVAYW